MAETYHFIGIGGAGMSALARVLHSRGVHVTGSDASGSATLEHLEAEMGVPLYVGQSAENIASPDLVVASAAIKDENPELAEARRRKIPVLGRADLLGKVMDLYGVRIAVSGTHGKTTTSAMAAQMLAHAGLDPTALIGADVPEWGSNTRVGQSEIVVAEACEAYGSFLELRPTHTIITNIEADHLDYYTDFDAIVSAFRWFARSTVDRVIACADGGAADYLFEAAGDKLVSYGIDSGDLQATILGDGEFSVTQFGEPLGTVRLNVPGRHNVLNALSVIALGISLHVPFETIAEGLALFTGTSRRFELLGEVAMGSGGTVTVIDDYAHHPTELQATLAAARQRYADRRIVALFQPHLPSRTRDLMDEFAASFADADQVLITDIYLARESAMPGITAERLADETAAQRGAEHVCYAGNLQQATDVLRDTIQPGDVVLTLGAGSVRAAGESLVREQAVLK